MPALEQKQFQLETRGPSRPDFFQFDGQQMKVYKQLFAVLNFHRTKGFTSFAEKVKCPPKKHFHSTKPYSFTIIQQFGCLYNYEECTV